MHPTESSAARRLRPKALNFIYFVDSSRTRNIQIPVRRFYVIAGVTLALALVILSTSIAYFSLLLSQRATQRNLKSALNTLFDYEVKQDAVFETAYPEHQTFPPPVAQSSNDALATRGTALPRASAIDASQKAASAAPAENKIETIDPARESVAAHSDKALLTIGNPKTKQYDNRLEFDFILKNGGKFERADGFIWAVAKFKAENGREFNVTLPNSLPINGAGEPTNVKRGYRFSIRHETAKQFVFNKPAKERGRFSGITIGFADNSGDTGFVPVQIDE